MLQLWEGWARCQGLPSVEAEQLTSYANASGEPAEGLSEGPNTAVWPCQLHHHGGESMGEEVLVGIFFLNERPIVILFDSGASHDSMNATCAKKTKLSLVASGAPYVISTAGGRVDADRIVRKVPLDLDGRVFETNLNILSGQGIDGILGMSWMNWHKVVLNISVRVVHLNSPVYGKVILHLPVISHIKAFLNYVVERKIEEIHIVREFSDVFPNELLGMPPERVIEFKIELQPSTSPIAKAKLKIQL
jgi:hypothetical protein